MLFKQKISVSDYCRTRIDLLFSVEQAELWLQLKRSCPDHAIVAISDNLYLTHLRAVHIELLSMVVTKKYMPNLDRVMQMSEFIETYLDNHNQLEIKSLLRPYSRALGSPIDGILAIVQSMMAYICQNQCKQETVFAFRELCYGAVQSIRADFKEVKLVK